MHIIHIHIIIHTHIRILLYILRNGYYVLKGRSLKLGIHLHELTRSSKRILNPMRYTGIIMIGDVDLYSFYLLLIFFCLDSTGTN